MAGNLEIAKMLLDRGADVKRGKGWLVNAVKRRQQSLVSLLLENGANVNDDDGTATALRKASELGDGDLVRLLLAKGSDPNRVPHPERGHWDSSLRAAVTRGHKDVVKMLLDAGADRGLRDALELAAASGYPPIVQDTANRGSHSGPERRLLQQGSWGGGREGQRADTDADLGWG
jgi:ankyrin repeat protein